MSEAASSPIDVVILKPRPLNGSIDSLAVNVHRCPAQWVMTIRVASDSGEKELTQRKELPSVQWQSLNKYKAFNSTSIHSVA